MTALFNPRLLLLATLALLLLLAGEAPGAQAQPTGSPWPMFRHDPQHTGRSLYVGPGYPVLKWSFPTGAGIAFSSPAIAADGTIYVGSDNGNLYAVNPDGSLKWAFPTGFSIWSSPALGADGTVYVDSTEGKLYAINPDGILKWAFPMVARGFSSPAVGPDGTIYVGSTEGNLYAINPDGSLRWAFSAGSHIESSPALGADGTIYVGSYDRNLYAINPDGTLKWAFPTNHEVWSSPAIGDDGTVFVGSYDTNLYAINPDGTLKWSFPIGSPVYSSPAIGSDGTIYVGSGDGKLYSVNSDGSLLWSFPTNDEIWSSPAIGGDGTVYIGSRDGQVYAIKRNGTLRWSFPAGIPLLSSPAIGFGGMIYVGSGDGNLYAVDRPTAATTMQTSLDTDGAAGVTLAIPQVYDPYAETPLPGLLISMYAAVLSYKIQAEIPAETVTYSPACGTQGELRNVYVANPPILDNNQDGVVNVHDVTLGPNGNGETIVASVLVPIIGEVALRCTGAGNQTSQELSYKGIIHGPLDVLDVRLKAPFGLGPVIINNPKGFTEFASSAFGGAPWPIDPLAFVALRLTGCTTDAVPLSPSFDFIVQPGDIWLPVDQPAAKTYRRGDAKANGVVDMADALFIAGAVVGTRAVGEAPNQVNAVNAASVKYDGAFDKITAADFQQIAQRAVGLRDDCFNLVPQAIPPQR